MSFAPVIAAHLLLNTFDEVIVGGSIDWLYHDRIRSDQAVL